MSFGISIGDFIAIGQLVFKVYRRAKESSEQYKAASTDLAGMHMVVKDITETVIEKNLSPDKKVQLELLCTSCRDILEDFDAMMTKYESLGFKSRRTWDRLRYDQGRVKELRDRMGVSIGLLNSFNLSLSRLVIISGRS